MIGGAGVGHQLWFGTGLHVVADVDIETTLDAQQRREQPDGARPGDQDPPRCPTGARADPFDVLLRLGHHAGQLEQHTETAERGWPGRTT